MRTLLPLTLLLPFLLSACATRFDPNSEYRQQLKTATVLTTTVTSNRTTVLFLVDGLSVQTLDPQIRHGHLSQIQKHFLSEPGSQVLKAHTLFPSLTFPSIASILKGAPVHKTGALGNTLIHKNKIISFESVRDREKFTEIMAGDNIFTKLNTKGQRTVSLDYGLGPDATVSSSTADLKIGLAATTQDYLYLDQKKLESLKLLLSKNQPRKWPEFIFIHLVGLDFISHHYGSRSAEAIEYLEKLDTSLKDVFNILQSAEAQGHQVVSMMTADHGFSPRATRSVDFEKELRSLNANLHSFNEHRMASIYARTTPDLQSLQSWSNSLLAKPGIETVAFREGNTVQISSRNQTATLTFVPALCPHQSKAVRLNNGPIVCPQHLEVEPTLGGRPLFYPYFLENLAYYFQAEKHPDMIVIPQANTVFGKKDGGFHGGPTEEEVVVPLLIRNGRLANPNSVPALWDLLNFL